MPYIIVFYHTKEYEIVSHASAKKIILAKQKINKKLQNVNNRFYLFLVISLTCIELWCI